MARRGDLATKSRDGAVFELRSGQFSLMVLAIRHLDLLQLQTDLGEHVASAPALLQGAPVVLDLNPLSQLADHGLLRELVTRVQQAGLRVIALAANPGVEDAAGALGLPLLGLDRKRTRALDDAAVDAAAPLQRVEVADESDGLIPVEQTGLQPPLVLPGPIRGGQQVYARGRDLIITGAVSAGAEVAADGCVHVYGRLSGKAMAGAAGDLRARVYCLSFAAEVVSIAGNFKVFESAGRDVAGKAVEIFLDEGRLQIRPLRI
jgi:septum site-determining protein MinC